jgi:hypothetical protein
MLIWRIKTMPNNGFLMTVKGDVTKPRYTDDNEVAVITHCCNDLGVMGAGVAVALKQAFSGVELFYLKSGHRLGTNSWVNPNTELNNVVVVNMVGQEGVRTDDNPIPVKYSALVKCMESVRDDIFGTFHMRPEYEGKTAVIHTPKFGSDLAGGNWDFILELIREIWTEHGIDVVIYEFE